MRNLKKLIPLIAVVLIALGVNLEQFGIDLGALTGGQRSESSSQSSSSARNTNNTGGSHASGEKWSSTSPEINLWHVFEGEINRKGKPVGYHSRPNGQDAPNARIKSKKSKPNNLGIYTAEIEIRAGHQWKGKFSSFFPDDMSQNEVVEAILHAYSKSKDPKKQPWSGPSGHGFQIQGYTSSRGGINTAFPIYVR